MATSFQDLFLWGMSREVPPLLPAPSGPFLNLGSGRKRLPFSAVDLDLPRWDARKDDIPFGTGQVAAIYAFHFFEHLDGDTAVRVIRECDRVLKTGGTLNVVVPYYSSQLQAQNLDHRSVWCEETWHNLLDDDTYQREYPQRLSLRVGFNVICGIVERNICLMTQLIRD